MVALTEVELDRTGGGLVGELNGVAVALGGVALVLTPEVSGPVMAVGYGLDFVGGMISGASMG